MPRNASGNCSLAVGAFASQTVIKSADVNSDLTDIASMLTDSLSVSGKGGMSSPLKLASGSSAAAPDIAWGSDTTTGLYLSGTHQISFAHNGVQKSIFNSDGSVTLAGNLNIGSNTLTSGAITSSGALAISGALTGATTGAFSGAVSTGNLTTTGTGSFSGQLSASAAILVTEIATPSAPAAGNVLLYSKSGDVLTFQNPAGTEFLIGKAPTVTRLTSGSSATYTPPAGAVRFRIRMVGGGGGGGAALTNGGSTATQSSFTPNGGSAWTAAGGAGANSGAANAVGTGGAGGSGGTNGTGTLINRISGQTGGVGAFSSAGGTPPCTGLGGSSSLFGGGGTPSNGAGVAGTANTGGGGSGGGLGNSGANGGSGGGGGSGESVEFSMTSAQMNGSAVYTISTGANGGAAGGNAGGNGGSGIILVEEFYS